MSAELLRRAAEMLRVEGIPDGTWTASPCDPRPNFALNCDDDSGLVELIASLLTARPILADLFDTAADAYEGGSTQDLAAIAFEAVSLAGALLGEVTA